MDCSAFYLSSAPAGGWTMVIHQFEVFMLGFKFSLELFRYRHQHTWIVIPFGDAVIVGCPALVVDDEWHNIVAQAFLKRNESTNTTVSVFKGEDLLEADVEVQNVITLDLGLLFVAGDQLCQTGMDLIRV